MAFGQGPILDANMGRATNVPDRVLNRETSSAKEPLVCGNLWLIWPWIGMCAARAESLHPTRNSTIRQSEHFVTESNDRCVRVQIMAIGDAMNTSLQLEAGYHIPHLEVTTNTHHNRFGGARQNHPKLNSPEWRAGLCSCGRSFAIWITCRGACLVEVTLERHTP